MSKEFLVTLNNIQIIDDEAGRVNRENIGFLIKALEHDVNVFGFSPKSEYESLDEWLIEKGQNPEKAGRYARNALFNLALMWIDFYSKNPVQDWTLDRSIFGVLVDPRNEIARKRCIEISLMPEFHKLLSFYAHDINYNENSDDIYERGYAEFMKSMNIRMHKTNQQTATTLMLYALSETRDKDAQKMVSRLREKYGDRYWGMPMI